MTKRELEQIGIAMGREFYNQCMTNGVPEGEMITSDKACELAGKSSKRCTHDSRRTIQAAMQNKDRTLNRNR
jgi:hypothetical protein